MLHYFTVAWLSSIVGAPEPALRLLLSMLLGYPAGWVARAFGLYKQRTLLLVYLTVCGFAIGLYNFGWDVGHSVGAVLVWWLSTKLFGSKGAGAAVIFNLAAHMGHLLVGYWFTGTDTYDIKWTMPHCVLTLRLIGLSFDVWDGTKPFEKLSASNRITALKEPPSLLEVAAHVYFPASFLVGPQFSLARLRLYVTGKFEGSPPPSCLQAGLKRGLIGLGYLAFYQIGTIYFPDDYFLTDAFFNASIIRKHIILGIWSKIVLAKYISCWLITEGGCITFGLAQNGVLKDESRTKWDGCRNVKLQTYEFCTKFGHYIDSFNINTNAWVAQYIYKRAAFLGSKQASQGITLLFLALWHGFHSGYYMTFFMEFATMLMEKDFETMVNKSQAFGKAMQNPIFKIIATVLLKLYVTIFMGFDLIPFTMLSFSKWWPIYKSLYFSGFIMYFPWFIVYKPILRLILKPKKIEVKTD